MIEKNLMEKAKEEGVRDFFVEVILQNADNILLLERPIGWEKGGHYELPSAEVKIDETLSQALHRTVMEKTGLAIEKVQSYLSHRDFDINGKKGRSFIFIAAPLEPFGVQLKEYAAFAWVSPWEAPSYPISDHLREILDLYTRWRKAI